MNFSPPADPKEVLNYQFARVDASRTFLTTREIAERMGCCIRHIGDMCREGVIKATRGGKGTDNFKVAIPDWQAFVLARSHPAHHAADAAARAARKAKARKPAKKTQSAD